MPDLTKQDSANRSGAAISPGGSPTISFCTTCKNRLHYLRQTMPANIEAHEHFSHRVEFVLLDYNSDDGLREWILESMSDHVQSGFLTVYLYPESEYYHSAHAKNVAHCLSRGSIVCNLDADNYLVPGLVEYVFDAFAEKPDLILFGRGRDATGRITMLREHFFAVGGYDEDMRGYGYDDVDLIKRAVRHLSLERRQLRDFNRYITHSHEERICNTEFASIDDSNAINRKLMEEHLADETYVVNKGRVWADARVHKNYCLEDVVTCGVPGNEVDSQTLP